MLQFRKPSTCNCGPGGYREYGHRWVVIQRRARPQSSQLKCLECGWKWWSTRNYIEKLTDHVEQSRSGMTDEDILARILDGTLTVLVNEARVFSFSRDTWNELRQAVRTSNGSTYRFVDICSNGKKKRVAVHRLVWMFAHRSIVPEGHDVDHIEGKLRDNCDAIDNLQLLPSSLNRSKGKPLVCQTPELPF